MAMTAKSVLAACAAGVVGVGAASGQVVTWTGNGLDNLWSNGANWDTGSIPGPTDTARIDNGGPDVTLIQSANSLDIVNSSSGIAIRAGGTFVVTGATSTNNGIITLNQDNSSVNAVLDIPNSTAFLGSGTIRLLTSADNSQITGAGTLVNGLGHSITGTGQINVGFINQGSIRAEAGNGGIRTLDIFAGGENQNLLAATQTASGPGTLRFFGVPIVQTGAGQMSASDGGQIEIRGGSSVTGGQLNTAGGGFVNTIIGATAFTDVTNNGDLFVDAGSTANIAGTGLVNNGTITLNNQNSSVNGILNYAQNGSLSGTGEAIMRTSADNSQVNSDAGVTISHGASHTIRGVGQVNAAINNAGTIAADTSVTFGTTILELQTNNKGNSGLLEARAASDLYIESIEIDQTTEGGGGRIESNDGTVSFFGAASVLGGEITSSGTGTLGVRSSSVTTFDGVVLDADFFIDANSSLLIDSGLVNNGTITLNNQNSSSNALLRTDQNIAIAGTGSIIMRTNADNSRIESFDGGSINLGSGQSILGVGEINAELTNNGVISADNSVVLSFSELELDDGPYVNNSRMTAEDSSELRVEDVLITQSPAATIKSNDGLVTISGNSRIVGGALQSSGAGLFRTFGAGDRELSGVTLDGVLQIDAAHTLSVDSAGLVNNGLIELNRNNSSSNANLDLADAIISGTGEIRLRTGGSNSFIRTDTGTTGTIGSGQLVRGAGFVTGDIVNNGVFAADGSVTLSGAELTINTDSFANNSTMQAETGSNLEISGTGIDQTGGGDMLAKDGGTIEFNATTGVIGGTLDSDGTGNWIVNGDVSFDGVEVGGTGRIDAGDALRIIGTTLDTDAFITMNPQNSSVDAVILIEDDQVTTLIGTGTIDGFTTGFGNCRISPTTVGANEGTLVNGPGHTLSGHTTLQVATTNQGTITVGRPFGDFFANDELTFTPGSIMNVTIGATGQSGQLDLLTSGSASLAGTLNVLLASGETLVNGNDYVIIDGDYTGVFDTVNTVVDGQLITRVRYEAGEVVVRTRCQADTNLDGNVTPADFNAWIVAFNNTDIIADQNLDGIVSPADFNAWIINFNMSCP